MPIKKKRTGSKYSRKTGQRRRAARRRMDEGEVTTTASPYREFQRDYASALWL